MKFVKTAKPTKIKITKSTSDTLWYNSLVGKEFIVEAESIRDYYVEFDGTTRGILKIDAICLK